MTHTIDTLPASLTERTALCHKLSSDAGWWDNQDRKDPLVLGTKIALIHSELSEAFEGALTGDQDDKLPAYPMLLVELADTCIRIYDLLGSQDYSSPHIRYLIQDMASTDDTVLLFVGVELARIHRTVSKSLEFMRKGKQAEFLYNLELTHAQIHALAKRFDEEHSLDKIILEKLNYNLHRTDHKRENRAAAGGKKI